jgi:hypothetical protein
MSTQAQSFSTRVFLLEDYSAPLQVLALDADSEGDDDFQQSLAQIFLLPERLIMQHEDWTRLSKDIVAEIRSNGFRAWVAGNAELAAEASELAREILEFQESGAKFAFTAIRNVVYLSSEGPLVDVDEYGVSVGPEIRQYVFDKLILDRKRLTQDEFSFWLRTTNLLQQPVSRSFHSQFEGLLEYEIPFGLSPKTKSETIEELFSQAKKVAIVPLIYGANQVGNAIVANQWAVAIKAAAAGGGAVIIMLSAIAIAEAITRWKRSSRENGRKGNRKEGN